MKPFLIIVLASFILICSCRHGLDPYYGLCVYNNSDNEIYAYLAEGGAYATSYPDTMLPEKSPGIKSSLLPIVPLGSKWCFGSTIRWNKIIQQLPHDTLSIFILDADTVSKYSWETIRNNNKILKRYDLSISDLEKTGYRVYYP